MSRGGVDLGGKDDTDDALSPPGEKEETEN